MVISRGNEAISPILMRSDFHSRYYVRLNPAEASAGQFAPVLEHLIAQTQSDGAVVYRFESETDEFRAVAARSNVFPKIHELGITLGVHASEWLSAGRQPLQVAPAENLAFENLPEGLQYGFRRVLLLPLRTDEKLLGYLTVGRHISEAFNAEAIREAQSIANIVAAVFERDELRNAGRPRRMAGQTLRKIA